jgi:hypothetical protein
VPAHPPTTTTLLLIKQLEPSGFTLEFVPSGQQPYLVLLQDALVLTTAVVLVVVIVVVLVSVSVLEELE